MTQNITDLVPCLKAKNVMRDIENDIEGYMSVLMEKASAFAPRADKLGKLIITRQISVS